MASGSVCKIDDREGWVVFTADAHQMAFTWKGVDYTAGIKTTAPGHVDYEAPPGTYVVWAERKDEATSIRTHKAVVAIHDEAVVTVRLLPDVTPTSPPEEDEPEPEECDIEVHRLEGRTAPGADNPIDFEVGGTAVGCSSVRVTVQRTDGSKTQSDATVQSDGRWAVTFDNEMGVTCGEAVIIVVYCVDDEACSAETMLDLVCMEEPQQRQ